MAEKIRLPSEIKQIYNFIRYRPELKRTPGIQNSKLSIIMSGMMSILPDEVKNSDFLKSEKMCRVASNFLDFGVYQNDRLDYQGAGRSDLEPLLSRTQNIEAGCYRNLRQSIDSLDNPSEAFFYRKVIKSFINETEFVESYVRGPGFELTVDNSIKYRRLINAIATQTLAAIIFGKSNMGERLGDLSEERLSWESVCSKYDWLFQGKAKNQIEKGLIAMERIVTVSQIDDDRSGVGSDRRLGVPSIAIAALEDFGGDAAKADSHLKKVRKYFIAEAIKNGLGILSSYSSTAGFLFLNNIGEKISTWGRENPDALSGKPLGRMAVKVSHKVFTPRIIDYMLNNY